MIPPKPSASRRLIAAIALVTFIQAAPAQTTAPAPAAAGPALTAVRSDPQSLQQARKALQPFANALQNAAYGSFVCTASVITADPKYGRQKFSGRWLISFDRAAGFAAVNLEPDSAFPSAYFNLQTLSLHSEPQKLCIVSNISPEHRPLDQLFRTRRLSNLLPMIELLGSDPAAPLLQDALAATLATQDRTTTISLQGPLGGWTVELSTPPGADQPMLERVRTQMKASETITGEMTLAFSDWQLQIERPAPQRFSFTPPAGVQVIQSAVAPGDALRNAPAPDFKTTMLAGEPVALDQHKGKVLILDFWATWCPPCVAALPALAELAQTYRDRGVVLLAINQAEPADTIRRFLDARQINIPVALDPDAAIARAYFVSSIPQTVVIGPDGLVAAVFVGFGPQTKQQIEDEIRRLTRSD